MRLASLRGLTPLFLLAIGCGAYRLLAEAPPPKIVLLRGEPWCVLPRYDLPPIATDAQLRAVLERMKPPAGKANTNVLVHALRLWGPTVDFGDPAIPSGPEMRAYFLQDAAFQRWAGADAPPLFALDPAGARVRPALLNNPFEQSGSVHVDDLLATLGEIGTPLAQPLDTRDGRTSVENLLFGALHRFHLEQQEYEWTAISYARFVAPQTSWTNEHGQRITVEELVDDLIQHPVEEGVCGGTHRLEALVVLLRVDDQAHFLAPRTRRKITVHLGRVSAYLVRAQAPQGYWTRGWIRGAPPRAGEKLDLGDEILLTGHHLEWLALAPPEVQPPRETIIRAGQWLVRAMLEVDHDTLTKWYGPFSHAARALCLWRSVNPADVWSGAAAAGQ
ncbi:MAG TPA: hypothetical protein VFE24_00050 [Pirellulales bacterium]|jgi:hypothetical protein|nr:hypothetical protein [Pirellulales bacterium]